MARVALLVHLFELPSSERNYLGSVRTDWSAKLSERLGEEAEENHARDGTSQHEIKPVKCKV